MASVLTCLTADSCNLRAVKLTSCSIHVTDVCRFLSASLKYSFYSCSKSTYCSGILLGGILHLFGYHLAVKFLLLSSISCSIPVVISCSFLTTSIQSDFCSFHWHYNYYRILAIDFVQSPCSKVSACLKFLPKNSWMLHAPTMYFPCSSNTLNWWSLVRAFLRNFTPIAEIV